MRLASLASCACVDLKNPALRAGQDELVKATRDDKYWWFIYILILKLIVNLIFLVGQSKEFNWGSECSNAGRLGLH